MVQRMEESVKSIDEVFEELDDLPPQTYAEIMRGLSVKRKDSGIPVVRIHYTAIPERDTPEWKEKEQKKFTKSGWDREWEIIDEAGGGDRIFADTLTTFENKIIIRDPLWFPDPQWQVVAGFDHGTRNPTALLKGYIDFEGTIYLAGEFYQMRTDTYPNEIWQNAPRILSMPDIGRARWVSADPSIFFDTQAQSDGGQSSIGAIYRKHGVRFLSPYEGDRGDVSKIARITERWGNLAEEEPRLRIVCRNESDRIQPGLHGFDCPNLLWELRRMRLKEMTATQLLVRNASEQAVDRDNHLIDALSYILGRLPRPTPVPLSAKLEQVVHGLDPFSASIAAQRFIAQQRPQKPIDMRHKGRMLR